MGLWGNTWPCHYLVALTLFPLPLLPFVCFLTFAFHTIWKKKDKNSLFAANTHLSLTHTLYLMYNAYERSLVFTTKWDPVHNLPWQLDVCSPIQQSLLSIVCKAEDGQKTRIQSIFTVVKRCPSCYTLETDHMKWFQLRQTGREEQSQHKLTHSAVLIWYNQKKPAVSPSSLLTSPRRNDIWSVKWKCEGSL